jgi:hypothetical protein
LIVDANAVLACEIAAQCLQSVARKNGDIAEARCRIEPIERLFRLPSKRLELLHPFALGESLGFRVSVTADHVVSYDIYDLRQP